MGPLTQLELTIQTHHEVNCVYASAMVTQSRLLFAVVVSFYQYRILPFLPRNVLRRCTTIFSNLPTFSRVLLPSPLSYKDEHEVVVADDVVKDNGKNRKTNAVDVITFLLRVKERTHFLPHGTMRSDGRILF